MALSRFRIWAVKVTLLLFFNSLSTLILFLKSLLLRFGPYSWSCKECDNVTFSVLGHPVDLERNVTMSRFRKYSNCLIYFGKKEPSNDTGCKHLVLCAYHCGTFCVEISGHGSESAQVKNWDWCLRSRLISAAWTMHWTLEISRWYSRDNWGGRLLIVRTAGKHEKSQGETELFCICEKSNYPVGFQKEDGAMANLLNRNVVNFASTTANSTASRTPPRVKPLVSKDNNNAPKRKLRSWWEREIKPLSDTSMS